MKFLSQVSVIAVGMMSVVTVGTALAGQTQYGDFSASVGLESDYRFRGITKSDEMLSANAGISWQHDSGFYAGLDGASVDLNDGNEATVEGIAYAGFGRNLGNGLQVSGAVTGTFYPGADTRFNYNYVELQGRTTYDFSFAHVAADLNYSPNFFGETGDAVYMGGRVDVPLMNTGITATATGGYQWIERNVRFGAPDYANWSLGANYNWRGVDLGAKYTDTNISNAWCADGCDATGVVSMGYKFF
ncbi:MAG: TorF family putative porin [Alphaproteobacteria bacterium]|nr:TorF family putative porin [Alphaproteobacteria bacterium]